MFLETGLLACVVVVIVAQLMPQIVASLYPVQFLELVVMRPAYYACIGLELCGFTHFCWVLAAGMAKVFRMRPEGVQVQASKGRQVDGWIYLEPSELSNYFFRVDKGPIITQLTRAIVTRVWSYHEKTKQDKKSQKDKKRRIGEFQIILIILIVTWLKNTNTFFPCFFRLS